MMNRFNGLNPETSMGSTVLPSATVTRLLLIYARNLPQEWRTIKGNYVFCGGIRFPSLTRISHHSLRSVLSTRSLHLLPHPPLRSVHKSRPPHLRPPLLLSMSTTSDPAPQSSSTKTVRVVIKGRVQGVFYRDWTVKNATQLGLKGWVRNKRDGSVEALFSGDPDKVQEMEQRCRRGPPSALVTGLQSFPCSDDDPISSAGFERKPTV